ncbi:MAG: hypothetical protein ACREB8_14680, partial [Pseudolabrys sp.]
SPSRRIGVPQTRAGSAPIPIQGNGKREVGMPRAVKKSADGARLEFMRSKLSLSSLGSSCSPAQARDNDAGVRRNRGAIRTLS